jgi:hypothetical protein
VSRAIEVGLIDGWAGHDLPSLKQKPDHVRNQGFLLRSLRDLVDLMQALAGENGLKGEKREKEVNSTFANTWARSPG